MKSPSHDDLEERARELVHRMHDVERWAYAIDATLPGITLTEAIEDAGYRLGEADALAKVARYEVEGSPYDTLVTLERPDLGVVLLQAFGPTTPDRLRSILERTGFLPQSRLLGEAYAIGSPRASQALTALAHLVVVWDDDWADLFLLHLASPDPIARQDAVRATVIAALSAHQAEPARALLSEALGRESFPQLRDTLVEAVAVVDRIGRDRES
jgi:hypothetical protein